MNIKIERRNNTMANEMTLQPLRKLIKKAGAKRVSDQAAAALGLILEEKAKMLLLEAKRLSEHSNRRTVMRRDIKAAKKIVGK
jgi:histone H3/H4